MNYTQKKNDYSDAVVSTTEISSLIVCYQEPMMVAGKDSEANVTFSYYLMNECRLVLQKGDNCESGREGESVMGSFSYGGVQFN